MEPLRTIVFDEAANAYIIRNAQSHSTRALLHILRPLVAKGPTPREVAIDYLRGHANLLGIEASELNNLALPVEGGPISAAIEYRFLSEKRQFDVVTVTFQKTSMAIPIWLEGVAVDLKKLPTVPDPLQGGLDRQRSETLTVKCFQIICARKSGEDDAALVYAEHPKAAALQQESLVTQHLARQINITWDGIARELESVHVLHQHPMIYRYDAAKRPGADSTYLPILLSPLSSRFLDGRSYHVVATYFDCKPKGLLPSRWLALVERETGAVLYIEPLAGGINGLVFLSDPVTIHDNGPMPDASNALLNPCRVARRLAGLDPPYNMQQHLAGANVKVVQVSGPNVAPPWKPPGADFDFDVRSDDFSAVNAYYHCDHFFRLVESLGFVRDDYFPGTEFPIAVDHRGNTTSNPTGPGIEVAAQCNPSVKSTPQGNVLVGIESVVFGVAENTVKPYVGIANDWRIVLHELGGHGPLQNHVGLSFFRFAHSAGDSLAAILNAPGSRAKDPGLTFPWILGMPVRRHDRKVQDGWDWDGARDLKDKGLGLLREQILSATHFRFYQSVGGCSSDIAQNFFAAKLATYLILRAIKTLTPPTNPRHASDWLCSLLVADAEDWYSEGLSGGAYAKVIYWAFEKQNLFGGLPPDVDVYVDDGRGGEYWYQSDYSNCPAVWNRLADDGGEDNQAPAPNVINYAYVKIRNRGGKTAKSVVVNAFQNRSGSLLVYPDDWLPMETSNLAAADLAPGSSEVKVGPFRWMPAASGNAILMAVSANGDPSNLQKFGPGRSISIDRLVPNDNNLAMRNV
jgi:hypothetical protein